MSLCVDVVCVCCVRMLCAYVVRFTGACGVVVSDVHVE